jgi:NADPH-dependent 2,4-dienoyl-CoA reductase/sulfur reductase-like enzyme
MAAGIEAVRRGCRVTLVDEAERPGGQIYRQAHPALGGAEHVEPAELVRKHALIERFKRVIDKVDYRAGATAYAAFGNGELHISEGGRTEVLRPDATILATGVRELAIPFPGWTLPGVMFAGGAQAILKSQKVLPGARAVVAGCGPLPLVVAAQLLRAGGQVAALALLRPLTSMLTRPRSLWQGREIVRDGFRYASTVRRAGVPRLAGYVPVRAIGTERLEAAVLARVDAAGRTIPGTEREIPCDLLAINYGFVANSELAAMAGARMRRDPVIGGWLPEVDDWGRTSIAGLFAAGDGAELRGALVAEADGTIVGAAAAATGSAAADASPGSELAAAIAQRARHMTFQKAVRGTLGLPIELWRLVADDTIVCRCENVRLAEIKDAIASGHRSLNAVKRNVRSGMGWCGGRTCLHAIASLVELSTGSAPTEMMTPRPLARPVSFAALARRGKAGAT